MENQNQETELKRVLRDLLGRASINGIVPDTTMDECIDTLYELKLEMAPSLSAADDWPRPKKRPREVRSLSFDNQNLYESVTDWSGLPISPSVILYFQNLLDKFSVTLPFELNSVTQLQQMTRDYADIRSLFLSNELIQKFLKPLSNGTGTIDVQQQLITIFLNLLMEQRIKAYFSENKRFFCCITSLLESGDLMVKLKASLVLNYFVDDSSNRHIMISSGVFKAILQFLGEAEADSFIVCLTVPTRVAFCLLRHVVISNTHEDLILTAVKVFVSYIKNRRFVMDMLTPLEMMSRSPSLCPILVREGIVRLMINLLKERRGIHIAEYGVSVLERCCRVKHDMLTIVSSELDVIQIASEIPECVTHKSARGRAQALLKLLADHERKGTDTTQIAADRERKGTDTG